MYIHYFGGQGQLKRRRGQYSNEEQGAVALDISRASSFEHGLEKATALTLVQSHADLS